MLTSCLCVLLLLLCSSPSLMGRAGRDGPPAHSSVSGILPPVIQRPPVRSASAQLLLRPAPSAGGGGRRSIGHNENATLAQSVSCTSRTHSYSRTSHTHTRTRPSHCTHAFRNHCCVRCRLPSPPPTGVQASAATTPSVNQLTLTTRRMRAWASMGLQAW